MVQYETHYRPLIAAKPGRFFPDVAFLEETDNGDGMSEAASGFVVPDRGFDQTKTDSMNGEL